MSMSLTVKKRKVLEIVTTGIREGLFNEEELDQIVMICLSAVQRNEKEADKNE